MQSTARKNELPLDRMCLICDVTKKMIKDEFSSGPREGAYIHGLFMEVLDPMIAVDPVILVNRDRIKSFHLGSKVGSEYWSYC